MRDESRTKVDLIQELRRLRRRVSQLERRSTVQEKKDLPSAEEIVHAMRDIVVIIDGKMRIVAANQAFARTCEITPTQAVGQQLFDLGNHLWDTREFRKQLRNVLTHGKPLEDFVFELSFHPLGRRRMLLHANRLFPKSDSSKLAILIAEDITERFHAQEVIKARLLFAEYAYSHTMDEILRRTLDEVEHLIGGDIGFFHFLEDDQVTLSLQNWSSNTLATMCSAEGKGRHYPVNQAGVWVDCIATRRPVIHNDYASLKHRKGMPPGHAPVVRELVVPVLRNDKIVAILGTGNKPTAYDERDVEMVTLLANVAWDIVLHKRAEEALIQRERDLAKAQEVAHVGSWQLDLRSNRLSWSDEVHRIFGLEPQQFGATFEAFLERVHPEDRERVQAAYLQAVNEKTRYEIVHRVARPDGEIRFVRERSEEVFDETGKAVRSLGTVLDITDLVQAQEELQKLNAELEERVLERTAQLKASHTELLSLNEQKNQFLGMVAHDLRNPLTVVKGISTLLQEGSLGSLDEKQVDALKRIQRSSNYMLDLVNDLLDVAKIEQGKLALNCSTENLFSVVQEAIAANQLLASPKEIFLDL